MLGLKLRDEFSGRRIKGTMIEMHNRNGTGALDKSASEFLKITYPSIDMIKMVEAVVAGRAELRVTKINDGLRLFFNQIN